MILGIDPGITGALAVYGADGLHIHDMPVLATRATRKRRVVDARSLAVLVDNLNPENIEMAVVEQQQAMPRQGVSSSFGLGRSMGVVEGILAAYGVPMTVVPPARWKRDLSVPAAKDGARERATQLFPASAHHWERRAQHGRAEAALLAWWGRRVLFRGSTA